MSKEKPAIKVIDLYKQYKLRVKSREKDAWKFFSILTGRGAPTLTALNKVNLEVQQGEIFGLLGPNGAGKTTLIKILSTLVLPDGGQAFVNGFDVVKSPKQALSRLQTVLAELRGLERRLTCRENLRFYATLYGIPRDVANKRIEELLAFLNLSDRGDSSVQKLSSGNYRRLILARALLKDASVILLDEPTVGLDPVVSASIRNMVKEDLARSTGATIVVSTHNLWEAEQICDRIAVIQKGRIVAVGSPSEIRHATSDRTSLSIGLTSPFQIRIPALVDQFREISGVLSAEVTEGREGILNVLIEGGNGLDYNKIFDSLTSMKLKVVSLEATRPSLESAFIKLVQEGQMNAEVHPAVV